MNHPDPAPAAARDLPPPQAGAAARYGPDQPAGPTGW